MKSFRLYVNRKAQMEDYNKVNHGHPRGCPRFDLRKPYLQNDDDLEKDEDIEEDKDLKLDEE